LQNVSQKNNLREETGFDHLQKVSHVKTVLKLPLVQWYKSSDLLKTPRQTEFSVCLLFNELPTLWPLYTWYSCQG